MYILCAPGSPGPNKEWSYRMIQIKDSRSYQWAKFGFLDFLGVEVREEWENLGNKDQDPKDPTGQSIEYAYQNSWGLTQRTIGVMVGGPSKEMEEDVWIWIMTSQATSTQLKTSS